MAKFQKKLVEDEKGNKLLLVDDIRKDAEKVRAYDTMYDMYYDEFDEFRKNNSKTIYGKIYMVLPLGAFSLFLFIFSFSLFLLLYFL